MKTRWFIAGPNSCHGDMTCAICHKHITGNNLYVVMERIMTGVYITYHSTCIENTKEGSGYRKKYREAMIEYKNAMRERGKAPEYDGYEIHAIDGDGNNLTGESEEYIDENVDTWSIFGNLPKGGIDCIADFYYKGYAFDYYEYLLYLRRRGQDIPND